MTNAMHFVNPNARPTTAESYLGTTAPSVHVPDFLRGAQMSLSDISDDPALRQIDLLMAPDPSYRVVDYRPEEVIAYYVSLLTLLSFAEAEARYRAEQTLFALSSERARNQVFKKLVANFRNQSILVGVCYPDEYYGVLAEAIIASEPRRRYYVERVHYSLGRLNQGLRVKILPPSHYERGFQGRMSESELSGLTPGELEREHRAAYAAARAAQPDGDESAADPADEQLREY